MINLAETTVIALGVKATEPTKREYKKLKLTICSKIMKQNFKPFDKVLVRENETEEWVCGIYSHYDSVLNSHCAMGVFYNECIPYEGNEALLGTTDVPKPKRWRAENLCTYWLVALDASAQEARDTYGECDNQRYEIGNYFRTREEAEKVAEKFKQLLKEG